MFCVADFYMLLLSSVAQTGDQVMLLSPTINLNTPTSLTFFYHMRLHDTDETAALSVFTYYSALQYFDMSLFQSSRNKGERWQEATVCLPVGEYSLAFVGTMGTNYMSDIGLCRIEFGKKNCSAKTTQQSSGSSLKMIIIYG